jgi:hypothetical protein
MQDLELPGEEVKAIISALDWSDEERKRFARLAYLCLFVNPTRPRVVLHSQLLPQRGVLCSRSALGLNSEAPRFKRTGIRAPQRLAKAMLLHALHSNHRVLRARWAYQLRRKRHGPPLTLEEQHRVA